MKNIVENAIKEMVPRPRFCPLFVYHFVLKKYVTCDYNLSNGSTMVLCPPWLNKIANKLNTISHQKQS